MYLKEILGNFNKNFQRWPREFYFIEIFGKLIYEIITDIFMKVLRTFRQNFMKFRINFQKTSGKFETKFHRNDS